MHTPIIAQNQSDWQHTLVTEIVREPHWHARVTGTGRVYTWLGEHTDAELDGWIVSQPGEWYHLFALHTTTTANVRSLVALPTTEIPNGKMRRQLMRLARAGADVYAYQSIAGIWNIWFLDTRYLAREFVARMAGEASHA